MQIPSQSLKIYLDNCCLSRSSDNQTQDRIRLEAIAVESIVNYINRGKLYWIVSEALVIEINKNPNLVQRDEIKELLKFSHHSVSIGVSERYRGKQLVVLGFKPLDALHIACAESGNADIFFTTDDKLLSWARRYNEKMNIRVENPHTWLQNYTM